MACMEIKKNGPWTDEPNKLNFEYRGFFCSIRRHDKYGHLCGYVLVAKDHPYCLRDYNDMGDIIVHGGVTLSKFLRREDRLSIDKSIGEDARCLIESSCKFLIDEDDEEFALWCQKKGIDPSITPLWAIGFDCAHAQDLIPYDENPRGAIYRDIEYAEEQVKLLAIQLKLIFLEHIQLLHSNPDNREGGIG
jgi:hypothetical protein